jgi:hypothetical protein
MRKILVKLASEMPQIRTSEMLNICLIIHEKVLIFQQFMFTNLKQFSNTAPKL